MADQDEPQIAARAPIAVSLEKGKQYAWCACGRSKSQPFCDGSHAGTRFKPRIFTAESDGKAHLCRCKRTKNPPFCDGTHAQLDEQGNAPQNDAADQQPPPRETPEEPTVVRIHELAKHGLSQVGHHGPMGAMGVPKPQLPAWDDIQVLPGQLAVRPRLDDDPVDTSVVIGPRAKRPLRLEIPLFVSDMSFGALSQEAKTALARGAEIAGTGICSGEGGMLPEEQAANSRYFYELASAMFGYDESLLTKVQAFHFKGGQGAKTGTGGHLPASKVTKKIASVRNLPEGTDAISPATFRDLRTPADFGKFAERVREVTGGIPIGMKLSANRIEADLAFSIEAGCDYVILDGRGGGTGAAPLIFRNHISVPTIPALARARRFLDKHAPYMTLVITGGLRVPEDFVKAMCLGADAIAVSNSALQAIGCVAARMCNSNQCPSGIATQRAELRKRLDVDAAAARLSRFFGAATSLMTILARACGHEKLSEFCRDDITSWKREVAELAGLDWAGPRD